MVPVPLPTWNPCRASWNWMEDDICKLMNPDIAFHRTSARPITLKSVHTPLEIITTIFHAHDAKSSTPLKSSWMMEATFSQFPRSGSSSCISAQSHILRYSALIPYGPLARCSCSHSTALAISSSPGIFLSTMKGGTYMVIGCPGVGTWVYSSARSSVRVSRYTRTGGGGLLAASL